MTLIPSNVVKKSSTVGCSEDNVKFYGNTLSSAVHEIIQPIVYYAHAMNIVLLLLCYPVVCLTISFFGIFSLLGRRKSLWISAKECYDQVMKKKNTPMK